jgi:hypothetical protein
MAMVELKKELITNLLIHFTLFLLGKFNSKVEQIESRTTSWNGLCSTFEGPLYIFAWHREKPVISQMD